MGGGGLGSGWAPVEEFELDLALAVGGAELGCEGQVESSDWQRVSASVPPDGFEDGSAVGDPEADMFAVGAETLQWAVVGEGFGQQLDGRVTQAEGFEAIELEELRDGQLAEAQFGVEAQDRLEGFRRECLSG